MDYSFIGIDEGKQQLFRGTTGNGIQWTVSLAEYPTARAMQKLSEQEILVGYDKGYFLINPESGNILHNCSAWTGVTSAHRCVDGSTLITGTDLMGMKGISVLTLDANDNVIDSVRRRGSYVRLMEVTEAGTYLFCIDKKIIETNRSLSRLGTFRVRGFRHAWKALRLPGGDTLISAGYGAFMVRFPAGGGSPVKFGAEGSVPEEVQPLFYAAFALAEDGNILLANWQGHGENQGHKGRQLLCFSPAGDYLESWAFPESVSSFQGLLLL